MASKVLLTHAKEWLKKGAGLHEYRGILYREETKYEISTYIAVLPDYKGFDWVFDL